MTHFKTEWVEQYIGAKDGMVFFDVGSYNGFAGVLFKTRYPESRVISIEANKELFEKMNNDKNKKYLEMFEYAICDKNKRLLFYAPSGKANGIGSINKPTIHISKIKGAEFGNPTEVEGKRLDTLCDELDIKHIDILHMDIQTGEYFALVGMGKMRPSMIFLEDGGYRLYENSVETTPVLKYIGYKQIDISNVTLGDKLWIYENN